MFPIFSVHLQPYQQIYLRVILPHLGISQSGITYHLHSPLQIWYVLQNYSRDPPPPPQAPIYSYNATHLTLTHNLYSNL